MNMDNDDWDKMPVIPKTPKRSISKEEFKEMLAEKAATAPAKLGRGDSHSMDPEQSSRPAIGMSLSQDDLVELANSLSKIPTAIPPQSPTFGVTSTSGSSSQPTKPVVSRLFGDEDEDDDDDPVEAGNITIDLS